MPKRRATYRIDTQPFTDKQGGIVPVASADAPIALPLPTVDAPKDVAVTAVLNTADRSATALISVTWDIIDTAIPTGYTVQWAENSGFTTNAGGFDVGPTFGTSILGLKCNQNYYVRVKARYGPVSSDWTNAATYPITTPQDTTAPSAPTSLAGAFKADGALALTWVDPTEGNFRAVEVIIKASSGGPTLDTVEARGGGYTWPLARHTQVTAGSLDASVYIECRGVSYAGYKTASPATLSVTKTPPSTPTVTTDFAGADAVWSWAAVAGETYVLTIDSVARTTLPGRHVYTIDQNRAEHGGTTPDPALSWSLVATDALNQSATAASGTLTNSVPSAPTTVTLTAGFSQMTASVSATNPIDFLTYRYRLIQTLPSATDVTADDPSAIKSFEATADATYQVGVKIVDVFGQPSTETLSSTVVMDPVTLAELRADALYSDSESTAAATLKAALADDDKASGGTTYPSTP